MKRLLMYRSGALGDFLLTLPAMEGIRQRWPEAERTLVTRPSYGELMREFDLIDAFVSIDSPAVSSLFSHTGNLAPATCQWLANFDGILAWIKDSDGFFERNVRAANPTAELRILNPVMGEGGMPASRQLCDDLPFQCPDRFVLPWKTLRPLSHRLRLAIHPGSGSPRKNLPIEIWKCALVTIAAEFPELEFLLITGEADEAESAMLRSLPIPWRLEARQLGLPILAHELRQCHGFIGHDTGIAHLAAACEVPCLLWFGPTAPAIWAPSGASVHHSQTSVGFVEIFRRWYASEAMFLQALW